MSDQSYMGRKFTITITVDPEAKEISVRDDAGNERSLRSIMLFGGDAEQGRFYCFGWGSSADAAWAYKEGLRHAMENGDRYYRSFYKQCACQIVQAFDPDAFRREADPWELLDRWEEEGPGRGHWN
ncbi:MAG: hypothetical protein Kow00128_02370 [Deltaproteobacteria bacterium]